MGSFPRQQFESRCRMRLFSLIVMRRGPAWDFDPAVHSFLAFLNNAEVHCLTWREIVAEVTIQYELVVVSVWEFATRPVHLRHAFANFGASQTSRLGISAGADIELPAGLGHRLYANEALWNADTYCGRC